MTERRLSGLTRIIAVVIALAFFAAAAALGITGARMQERWGTIAAVGIGLLGAVPLMLGVLVLRSALTGRRVRALEAEQSEPNADQ